MNYHVEYDFGQDRTAEKNTCGQSQFLVLVEEKMFVYVKKERKLTG